MSPIVGGLGSFDLHLFISTFSLIFVAEWPDKTAFATILLATQKHPVAVFIGVALAFFVQTIVAVAFGHALSLLPQNLVRIGAGVLFLGFAVAMWLRKGEEEEEAGGPTDKSFWKTVASSFVVIFIAEWGDLTQLSTAAFEAKYQNPWTIFPAALLALWCVTGLAILIGHRAKKMINPVVFQKIAAIAFAVVGMVILVQAF